MVEIRPKIVPEIADGQPIGFKTKNNTKHSSHLNWRTDNPKDHLTQNELVAAIWVMLEQFRVVLCEVSLEIGSNEGKSKYNGMIEPYDQTSYEMAEAIWTEIMTKIDLFSDLYPRSSFSMSCSQTLEITPPQI